MSEVPFDNIVYSKNVIEFITVGKEYCALVENHASTSTRNFLVTLQKMLPLLYLKATLLPAVEEEGVPEKFVTEVDYNYLLNRITGKLGKYDSYQEVFEPGMQFSEQPIEASIAENICDIYQDIKDFMLNFRIGSPEAVASALWECRNNFEQYWGQKLVNGMRAIHQLVYSEIDSDDNTTQKSVSKKKKTGSEWLTNHFNNKEGEEYEEGI